MFNISALANWQLSNCHTFVFLYCRTIKQYGLLYKSMMLLLIVLIHSSSKGYLLEFDNQVCF